MCRSSLPLIVPGSLHSHQEVCFVLHIGTCRYVIMVISAFDLEHDPFGYDDYEVDPLDNGPSSSSSSALPTDNSLRLRTAAAMVVQNDKIEQHALHSICLDGALPEVPWTLDSS